MAEEQGQRIDLSVAEALSLAARLASSGDGRRALGVCGAILARLPTDGRVLRVAARIAAENGLAAEAGHFASRLLSAIPADPDALNVLGILAMQKGAFAEAQDHFSSLAGSNPCATAFRHLGMALAAQDRIAEAMENFRKAISMDSASATAYGNLGDAHLAAGEAGEALKCYEKALELSQDKADARYSMAFTRLLLDDYTGGWNDYESRLDTPLWRENARPPEGTVWRGESLRGKKILVYSEMGFGDTVQFSRFVPAIKGLGAEVFFRVQDELAGLLEHNLAGTKVIPASARGSNEMAELVCPLHSLPLRLGITDSASIPGGAGYLRAQPEKTEAFRREFAGRPGRKIGLAWAGDPSELRSRRKSIPIEALAPLFGLAGASFFSLQKGQAGDGLGGLPAAFKPFDLGPALRDFSDTAAAVESLDLVIAVCSSVAHLSCALGRETWVLLSTDPFWCWGRSGYRSPWYASARLFRQNTPGDWGGVIAEVKDALEAHISRNRPHLP